MKKELSGVDVYHFVQELKTFEGGKVEKVYQWEDDDAFLFRLYARGNKNQLRVVLPGLAYLTQKRIKAPRMPPGFCRFLRKHVQGGRIEKVKQKQFDRLIEIQLSTKHGQRILIFELFKPSNIVVLDHEKNIIHPFRRQSFKDRQIKSRHPYTYPPLKPNIPTKTFQEFNNLLASEEKNLGKNLATTCGLGGTYAEEVIQRAKQSHNAIYNDLSEEQRKIVYNAVQSLFEETNPCKTDKDEVFPVKMQSKNVVETYDSFSEAIDSQFTFTQVATKTARKSSKNKWEAIINAQENQVKKLTEKIEENQEKAEWLYEHYNEVKTLIKKIQEAVEEERIQEVIDKHDYIKSYDPETKEVTINVK